MSVQFEQSVFLVVAILQLVVMTDSALLGGDFEVVSSIRTVGHKIFFSIFRLKPLFHWDATVCDSLRLAFASESQGGLETVAVIRNFLACVAKSRKRFAKILNMFKNFMRQNSSQNRRKVIADVSNPSISNPSRTCRGLFAI